MSKKTKQDCNFSKQQLKFNEMWHREVGLLFSITLSPVSPCHQYPRIISITVSPVSPYH